MSATTTTGHQDLNSSLHNISIYESQYQNTSNHEHLDVVSLNEQWVVRAFIIFLCICPTGILVNYKLFNIIRKEKKKAKGKVIQAIMKAYAIIQIVGWPLIICAMTAVEVERMSYIVIDPCLQLYVLDILRALTLCLRLYVGFNSLIIAISRYCFTVCDVNVTKYGIQRTGRILISLSFVFPLVITILNCVFVNGADMFPEVREYKSIPSFLNNNYKLTTSSMYKFSETLIYSLVRSHIPSFLHYGMLIFCYGLVLIIISNFIEGVLYYHIFAHVRR